jgi:hypothetical protein
VKFYTGDKQSKAGFDMSISLKLFGDNKISEEFKLKSTVSNQSKFMPNQVF